MARLKNTTITAIERKGKMLIFILDDKRYILSHLGMTGSWRISPQKLELKHVHLSLQGITQNNRPVYLSYVDPRRFGHMYLYHKDEAYKKLDQLGTDLMSADFTLPYLKQCLDKYPARKLKVGLLDQSLFAGMGNYMANEICARAGILPQTLMKELRANQYKKIYKACQQVLHAANHSGGTTFQGGYNDAFGEKGAGVKHLVVFYQKICQLCKKTEVVKIFLAQRGTYYCPHCQK